MNDYIERQAMLDAVDKLKIIPSLDGTGKPTPTEDFRVQFLGTVLKVTAADVVPVVYGHWIRHDDADIVEGYYVPEYECSKCGAWKKDDSDFCPDCGARMDGKRKE